ncbi:HlyD family efflux transporter periplasmic adaptor subunit [Mesobacterium sp. TK19101]|uniref:HlyD family efflux transporter periplasmic adaptor subunit n=1 Tax=Mesobacterium hydrothermale TaxID=3111907 RepID=A0ABU6HGH7_9RHOB|nr:HlyD family efflux transporter periplasmic adaptor subunit [Mesobacterium sp. TK19101]MEC3861559.1 HlyD family efflux transporter periplasmic adaptor subunit [Mesobacterium sp. TK19101]
MSLLCSLPFAAALFAGCAPPSPLATGYVEGEYVLVAPVEVAQVEQIAVARGDKVAAGDLLVSMDSRDAEIAVAEATANLAQAQSQLADLLEGARPEEIAVIEANLASAKLQADEAERERDRVRQLYEKGVATIAQRDNAVTAADVAEARVTQISAELAVARLPARPQAIDRAKAAVDAAEAARNKAEWRLDQRKLTLSEPVTVVDVIRQVGELAGPSAPVLSVLPDGAVKLRLYVPETAFESLKIGALLKVSCDGCAPDLTAKISYISDEPEFTPPVIYSLENRQKLVYLIEARPSDGKRLKPGQIVDVSYAGGQGG